MNMATRLFAGVAGFGLVAGGVYWFVTYEWAGFVLLEGLGLMAVIVALYAAAAGGLRERRPEDDPDADPRRHAGEDLGAFPASTVWPIFLVLGAIAVGASLVYGLILLTVGLALVAWAVIGFVRESRD